MRTLLVATGSAHKLAELRRLFGPLPFDLRTLADEGIVDEAPEEGATFAANAIAKARFYAAASGLFTLADDSGLEVEALDGAPGVSTRRYAGPNATDEENIEKLLGALRGLPPERRGARFVCTMAIVDPQESVTRGALKARTFRGSCRGRITGAPRGAFGFGYDPVFEVRGRTMAERSPAEKDRLSHRGRAALRAGRYLRELAEKP